MDGLRCFTDSLLARHTMVVEQQGSENFNISLLRVGFLGVSPVQPSFAISLEALEFYHRLRRRMPRCGIQPFVRTLSDVHEVCIA